MLITSRFSFVVALFFSFFLILFNSQSIAEARKVPELFFYPNPSSPDTYLPAIIDANEETKFSLIRNEKELENHIHFLLYTRESPRTPEELIIGDTQTLQDSRIDLSSNTKIIVHGFTNSDQIGFPPAARQAYFNANRSPSQRSLNLNLIIVDWGKLCQAPWYSAAASNTRLVGLKLARFIEFLVERGSAIERIHLIGHSLGAHVSGFAGAELRRRCNMTLSRITALDPALPLFEEVSDENRIDPSDASFVDVIHTAGGSASKAYSLIELGAGAHFKSIFETRYPLAFLDPRGHADFYVNGGKKQPGCGNDMFGVCSHLRAFEYYLESVENPFGFKSCRCEDWEEYQSGNCPCSSEGVTFMGEHCSTSARGFYFLRTGPRKPYALQ